MTPRRAAIEIVAIGDELLLGDTIDTNGAWLGQRLAGEGIVVSRRTITGDNDASIRDAVSAALQRTSAVVCCGGLGPTPDDRTRPVIAALYDWPLAVDEAWVETIRQRFEARGMTMPQVNRVQAEVPRGATLLANAVGTAPGLLLDDEAHGLTILLPGVPGELRWLTEHHVIPQLLQRLPRARGRVLRRVLRTTGIAESALSERIQDVASDLAPLTLAFLPMGTGIDLRVTSWGDLDEDAANAALDRAAAALRERLGRIVYAEADQDMAAVVGNALRVRGLTVALAESCTGGLVAKRLTDIAGSSDYVLAGIATYANAAKTKLLGVPEATLREHGAVSEATAAAMLAGVRRVTGADCAISITGVAGPGGGTPEKPVGTVWVGTAVRERTKVRLLRLFGTRMEIRERAAQLSLKNAARPAGRGRMNAVQVHAGEGSLRSTGGLMLHYHTWEVPAARAALLVVPGLSDHGRRYARVGQWMAAHDISTFALDTRGNGMSDGRRGHVSSFSVFLQDLNRFRREVQGLIDPGTPAFLLGHSMGGLMALRYLQEYGASTFAGAILVSPWLGTAMRAPAWKVRLATTLSKVLPAAPFRAHIPPKHLCRDAEVVRAWENDPASHDRITPRLFVEATTGMRLAFQQVDRLNGPLLFMLAGDDRVADTRQALALARAVPDGNATIRVYEGYYHEVLFEPHGGDAMRDLAGWLGSRID